MVGLEDGINHCPRGLNCILTTKERSVAGHGIAQKQIVGRHGRMAWNSLAFSLWTAPKSLPAGASMASSATIWKRWF